MRPVYVVADNIYSPLGQTTISNMLALKEDRSGIREHQSEISDSAFYASLFSPEEKRTNGSRTFFEEIVLRSARESLKNSALRPENKKTGFILSSTKGNIGLIENITDENIPERRVSLADTASGIAAELGFVNDPLVVSHACISGLLAMITGMRLIQSGRYDEMMITGADLISAFIYTGFRSFQAISPNPCRPFDADRDGISLGEAAATVILSSNKVPGAIALSGGSVSNDANHISGPSRTGEELWLAIGRALKQADKSAGDMDFISAHGTATRYNDEMEAKAIHLAGMQDIPVNSLKGFYGHTLGAAGILESIITMQGMKESILFPTKGFDRPGTEKPVNVVRELKKKSLRCCLKTASGFGGCNAALIMVNE